MVRALAASADQYNLKKTLILQFVVDEYMMASLVPKLSSVKTIDLR